MHILNASEARKEWHESYPEHEPCPEKICLPPLTTYPTSSQQPPPTNAHTPLHVCSPTLLPISLHTLPSLFPVLSPQASSNNAATVVADAVRGVLLAAILFRRGAAQNRSMTIAFSNKDDDSAKLMRTLVYLFFSFF